MSKYSVKNIFSKNIKDNGSNVTNFIDKKSTTQNISESNGSENFPIVRTENKNYENEESNTKDSSYDLKNNRKKLNSNISVRVNNEKKKKSTQNEYEPLVKQSNTRKILRILFIVLGVSSIIIPILFFTVFNQSSDASEPPSYLPGYSPFLQLITEFRISNSLTDFEINDFKISFKKTLSYLSPSSSNIHIQSSKFYRITFFVCTISWLKTSRPSELRTTELYMNYLPENILQNYGYTAYINEIYFEENVLRSFPISPPPIPPLPPPPSFPYPPSIPPYPSSPPYPPLPPSTPHPPFDPSPPSLPPLLPYTNIDECYAKNSSVVKFINECIEISDGVNDNFVYDERCFNDDNNVLDCRDNGCRNCSLFNFDRFPACPACYLDIFSISLGDNYSKQAICHDSCLIFKEGGREVVKKYENDVCDDFCLPGTDCSDCGPTIIEKKQTDFICENFCFYILGNDILNCTNDKICQDGGNGEPQYTIPGYDCDDCGVWPRYSPSPPPYHYNAIKLKQLCDIIDAMTQIITENDCRTYYEYNKDYSKTYNDSSSSDDGVCIISSTKYEYKKKSDIPHYDHSFVCYDLKMLSPSNEDCTVLNTNCSYHYESMKKKIEYKNAKVSYDEQVKTDGRCVLISPARENSDDYIYTVQYRNMTEGIRGKWEKQLC